MAHGSGNKIDIVVPRSKFYQGPFGRLCPDLPGWHMEGSEEAIDVALEGFARNEMIERPGVTPSDLKDVALVTELDQEFGSGDFDDPSTGIPAGYTYFGQFVDHDITFDPTSSLMRQNDPNALLNFRTPRLDLDNIYGRGRDDQPYMFERGTGRMLIGEIDGTGLPDLPRNQEGRALIGDMRNDENSIVSQIQLAFLMAHNELVDRATKMGHGDPFTSAQNTLRWLYQWVVWNDFLKRICKSDVHAAALSLEDLPGGRRAWALGLGDVYSWKHQPFMPIEFSVAAYRFGHSMVRNAYQTNFPLRGFNVFAPIFDNSSVDKKDDLRGFRAMPAANVIQWDWFLKMTSSSGPFPQRARRIDTKLSNALAHLHEDSAGDALNVLAFRNLKRGLTFGLPTGADVARKWCIPAIELPEGAPDSLWFYVLAEAEQGGGAHLGTLGSTIVAATFAGLLKGDPNSYVNMQPCWTPDDDPLLRSGEDNIDSPGAWELASIIRLSGLPVAGGDIQPSGMVGATATAG